MNSLSGLLSDLMINSDVCLMADDFIYDKDVDASDDTLSLDEGYMTLTPVINLYDFNINVVYMIFPKGTDGAPGYLKFNKGGFSIKTDNGTYRFRVYRDICSCLYTGNGDVDSDKAILPDFGKA